VNSRLGFKLPFNLNEGRDLIDSTLAQRLSRTPDQLLQIFRYNLRNFYSE
jgi:hypothetical protein